MTALQEYEQIMARLGWSLGDLLRAKSAREVYPKARPEDMAALTERANALVTEHRDEMRAEYDLAGRRASADRR